MEKGQDSSASRRVAGAGKPKVSALAVVALVVAAIPCCPLTGLVGAFLGVIALGRIRRSGGGGKRIALAAVLIGAISAIISSAMLDRLATSFEAAYETGIQSKIALILKTDENTPAQAVTAAWVGPSSKKPEMDAIRGFANDARDRYGRFDRFALLSMTQTGSPLQATLEVAGVFHFENGDRLGSARFKTVGFSGMLEPDVRLIRIVIEDPDLGELAIGAAEEKK